MSGPFRPMMHFRLVDDRGVVLVDEDVWLEDVAEKAEAHGELARRAVEAGRETRLYITDPDGIVSPKTIITRPKR